MKGRAKVEPEDRAYIDAVRATVSARMFGLDGYRDPEVDRDLDDIVNHLLVALVTGGHVLIEGNPGLGKTALVKTLNAALGLAPHRWGRIQFTPDLMPADITGTLMPREDDPRHFAFQPGPIFRWLLLADEINRATPKTQAAMLEAMGEGQVTVLGITHSLRVPEPLLVRGTRIEVTPPFTVMATQNPIDQEGTYDLPEAQADRFMVKLLMPTPGPETLVRILGKDAGAVARPEPKGQKPANPAKAAEAGKPSGSVKFEEPEAMYRLHRIAKRVPEIVPQQVVEDHIVNLMQASHGRADDLRGLDPREAEAVATFARQYFDFGLGPRGAIAMMLGAKAWALMVLPGDGENTNVGLARMAVPTLRHRLRCRFGWEDEFRRASAPLVEAAPTAPLQDLLLARFALATAPERGGYRDVVAGTLEAMGLPVSVTNLPLNGNGGRR